MSRHLVTVERNASERFYSFPSVALLRGTNDKDPATLCPLVLSVMVKKKIPKPRVHREQRTESKVPFIDFCGDLSPAQSERSSLYEKREPPKMASNQSQKRNGPLVDATISL
jgi:hypothetical protein